MRRLRRQEKYQSILTLLGLTRSPEQLHAATQDQQNVRAVLAVASDSAPDENGLSKLRTKPHVRVSPPKLGGVAATKENIAKHH
jgi:hypothetical protein